jgi:uncharacterized protein YecE (DUF72 family)
MERVLIGISAWADPALVKAGFYPDGIRTPEERLGYYAERFPIAELDSGYHALPTRRNLEVWLGGTPDGFVFDLRAFSMFTQHPTPLNALPRVVRAEYGEQITHSGNLYPHHLPAGALDALWSRFSGTAEELQDAGKLGVVLFQFPPWFHPRDENREYVRECRRRLPAFPLAVEFRVPGWLDEDRRESTLILLREAEISLVCVDEPQGLKTSVPPVAELSAPTAVIRFHGRNAAAWETKGAPPQERFHYLYNDDELAEWVPRIRRMSQEADRVHVIFKNKYEDHPVRNALRLRELLAA